VILLNPSVKSGGRLFYEKKKKRDVLKAILSIRKRASKLTNLNGVYQLSLLLLPNKNKSLQAVLKPKLLLYQYFPDSASWPTALLSLNLFFHGAPRNRGFMPVSPFLLSLSRQDGQAMQKRCHCTSLFVPTWPGQLELALGSTLVLRALLAFL